MRSVTYIRAAANKLTGDLYCLSSSPCVHN